MPGARSFRARPLVLERKKIDIDRADVDLLLGLCEPGSTLEEPTITPENYCRFIVAEADAERQRRLAQEGLKREP